MKESRHILKYSIVAAVLSAMLLLLLGYWFVTTAQRGLRDERVAYLQEISLKSAGLVREQVNGYFSTIEAIASIVGSMDSFSTEETLYILQNNMNKSTFKRMGIILPDGTAYTTDGVTFDFSDRAYFQGAMQGRSVASDCLIDKVDGRLINVFSTPINHDGSVVGVIFATKTQEQLSEALSIESFNGEGYSYIINSDGRPVVQTTHPNSIGEYENLFESLREQQVNSAMYNKLYDDISNGRSDFMEYTRGGIKRSLCYTGIGVSDWYILSSVPSDVISEQSDRLIQNLTLLTALIVLVSLVISARMIRLFQRNNRVLTTIAYTDTVTGYSNWAKFKLDAEQILQNHPDHRFAMIVFDINKFKLINDMLGYANGNSILKFTAEVIQKQLGERETFGRVSADNFDLLVQYHGEEEILRRLMQIVNELEGYVENYRIKISAGIYCIDDPTTDVSVIGDRANISKAIAKKQNDTFYHFFKEENRLEIIHEKEIENAMEDALSHGEFELYLQPKYCCKTDGITGAEALVRWNRGALGVISPNDFIPLFEKNGFVRKLDLYMFEGACSLLEKWQQQFPQETVPPISVNISRIHLSNQNLPQELLNIAKRHHVPPERMEIELTESAVFRDLDEMITIMGRIRAAGFMISIDDFGSGYSSLASLKYLPADFVKMDKSFLDEAEHDQRGLYLIRSMIHMIQSLGMSTVAEGVETQSQLDFLKSAGCDIVQGYYWSRPIPVTDFEKLAFPLEICNQ